MNRAMEISIELALLWDLLQNIEQCGYSPKDLYSQGVLKFENIKLFAYPNEFFNIIFVIVFLLPRLTNIFSISFSIRLRSLPI
jgi:hypothetical protein